MRPRISDPAHCPFHLTLLAVRLPNRTAGVSSDASCATQPNSATELEYHLMIARDIRAISLNDYAALASRTVEVRKMLRGLIKKVAESQLIDQHNSEKSKVGGSRD